LKLTYYGHSCVLVETSGRRLIIDPFLTGNPTAPVAASEVRADYVLLTHGHNDHVGDAFEIAKRCDAVVIAPFELATYAGWQGCKTHPMHIGGAHAFDFGTVKLTPALHGSGYEVPGEQRLIYMGMPAGLLLTSEGRTVYHAGDTALFEQIAHVPAAFNRMIVYRRNVLHSGNIAPDFAPSTDPSTGRLSINCFIDPVA